MVVLQIFMSDISIDYRFMHWFKLLNRFRNGLAINVDLSRILADTKSSIQNLQEGEFCYWKRIYCQIHSSC